MRSDTKTPPYSYIWEGFLSYAPPHLSNRTFWIGPEDQQLHREGVLDEFGGYAGAKKKKDGYMEVIFSNYCLTHYPC